MYSWNWWFLCYFLPAATGTIIAYKKPTINRLLLIHYALIVSILLIISTGVRLHLQSSVYAYLLFLISSIIVIALLGWRGLAYSLSSVIQELSLLLAAILVGPTAIGITATALVYSLAHLISPTKWKATLSITFTWGICSIFIYFWLQQPALNMAIHLIGGIILIKRGIVSI